MDWLVIFIAAFLLRIVLIWYGDYHDAIMEVKYTDIDYSVFTEAAGHIANDTSPYKKDTYKYTPMLAYLLLPNIYLDGHFGKILFCVFDIVVGIIQMEILAKKYSKDFSKWLVCIFWLFNPFTMTISSRGNAESLQMFLVSLSLLLLINRHVGLSAILFGLSVHFKLYPVIYAVPYLLHIANRDKRKHSGVIENALNVVFSIKCLLFGCIALAIFLCVGYGFYLKYDTEFIENTYLFHFRRIDSQHNFSPYFYILLKYKDTSIGAVFKSLAFCPQLISVVYFGWKYSENPPFACFIQTFAFVTLNKVCTSQYFIWYIGLLPLAYPYMNLIVKEGIFLLSLWLGAQCIWLGLAYLYEFRKYNILIFVWYASIVFLLVNVYMLYRCQSNYQQSNLRSGTRELKRKPLKDN